MPALRLRDPALLLILAAAAWGLGTVVSKRAVDALPPATLLAVQLAASVVTLLVTMRLRGMPIRGHAGPPLLGRLGILNPGIAYALGLAGLVSISASLAVLLWVIEPVLILALAVVVLGERVGSSFVLLTGLALGGLVLVLYEPGTTGAAVGILLTVVGVVCCAVYTIVARRFIGEVRETAAVVVVQQSYALGAALILVAIVVAAGGQVIPAEVPWDGWASALVSGVLYYAVAYWAYLSALGRVPASRAAVSFYLIPVFGIAGGMLLLDERLSPVQWLGAIAVVVAVATILRTREDASAPVSAPA